MNRLRERLDQQRLGEARHAAQQHVAAGEERRENFLDNGVLADDRAAELVPQSGREALRLVKLHRTKLYQLEPFKVSNAEQLAVRQEIKALARVQASGER